jgi:hypothetical protein
VDCDPDKEWRMDPHHGGHHHGGGTHAMGTHNMAVLGDRRIYLSHLPMFMSPHDAQVILDVTFMRDGKGVDDVYRADRGAHPSITFYTLSPEEFALNELFAAGTRARTQFKSTVFRGHLEKGGNAIDLLTDIDVRVNRVVHAHVFEGMDKLSTLSHVLFGSEDRLFLAHLISKPPDFDQILSVRVTGDLPTAEALHRGPTVEVAGRVNQVTNRLKAGETVPARWHVVGAHEFHDVTLAVVAELYFEEGELSSSVDSPKLFQQTTEEKKAGFI